MYSSSQYITPTHAYIESGDISETMINTNYIRVRHKLEVILCYRIRFIHRGMIFFFFFYSLFIWNILCLRYFHIRSCGKRKQVRIVVKRVKPVRCLLMSYDRFSIVSVF